MGKKSSGSKIGRDAKTGEFRTVEYARKHPNTICVETVKKQPPKKKS